MKEQDENFAFGKLEFFANPLDQSCTAKLPKHFFQLDGCKQVKNRTWWQIRNQQSDQKFGSQDEEQPGTSDVNLCRRN